MANSVARNNKEEYLLEMVEKLFLFFERHFFFWLISRRTIRKREKEKEQRRSVYSLRMKCYRFSYLDIVGQSLPAMCLEARAIVSQAGNFCLCDLA